MPPARSAILRWLGHRQRAHRVRRPPAEHAPRTAARPRRANVARPDARKLVEYHVLTSELLGTPSEVRLLGDQVGFVYGNHKLVVTQSRGTFFTKEVGPGTHVERLSVNGRPAYWISGAPPLLRLRRRERAAASDRAVPRPQRAHLAARRRDAPARGKALARGRAAHRALLRLKSLPAERVGAAGPRSGGAVRRLRRRTSRPLAARLRLRGRQRRRRAARRRGKARGQRHARIAARGDATVRAAHAASVRALANAPALAPRRLRALRAAAERTARRSRPQDRLLPQRRVRDARTQPRAARGRPTAAATARRHGASARASRLASATTTSPRRKASRSTSPTCRRAATSSSIA